MLLKCSRLTQFEENCTSSNPKLAAAIPFDPKEDDVSEEHDDPEPELSALDDQLRKHIIEAALERGVSKTLCPSEVARAIGGKAEKVWRQYMKPIRANAVEMARAGEIEIRRKGKTVDPDNFKGVYRIGLPLSGT